MDYAAYIVTFSMFWKMSWSIECYKCEPEPDLYRSLLCEHFNYTDAFLVQCEFSTMCFKKEVFLDIGNGIKSSVVQRGCAKQLLNGDQEKKNGQWSLVKRIYESYEEKCQEDSSNREKVTKTVHCYCRGALCNSGPPLHSLTYSIVVLIAALSVLFS